MGNPCQVRHLIVQKRKGALKNERGGIQEENEEGVGQTNVREKEKEGR